MKKQWINKSLRIILFTGIGAAVIGTFYFLWKKSQPVVTVYEVVSPKRDTVVTKTVATGNVEPRYEVEIKPQISGIIAELRKEAGIANKIENGAEEVAEIELTVAVNPDENGFGKYEALDKLLDETIKGQWMTAFTPDLVKA